MDSTAVQDDRTDAGGRGHVHRGVVTPSMFHPMNAAQIATKYRLTLHNLQTGEIASRTAHIAQELLDFVDYECLLGGYDMTFDATTPNFGCIYPEGSATPVGTWSVTERKA